MTFTDAHVVYLLLGAVGVLVSAFGWIISVAVQRMIGRVDSLETNAVARWETSQVNFGVKLDALAKTVRDVEHTVTHEMRQFDRRLTTVETVLKIAPPRRGEQGDA